MKALLFVTLISVLTACGGGGGGDGTAAPVPAPPASTVTPPAIQASTVNWNLSRVSPAEADTTVNAVEAILDHVFGDAAVQSAMLVKDGYIVGERYAEGIDANTLGTSWSVAKSYYSAAVGIAVDEGWISSLDQPASDFFTEWEGSSKSDITIRDLLECAAAFPLAPAFFLLLTRLHFRWT